MRSQQLDKKVWAVVPCFNRVSHTTRFLENFFKQTYKNKEVVIVDDGSSDNTILSVKYNFPSVHCLRGDGDLWWSGGTNLGVKYALENGADYILTINDDSQFDENLLINLIKVSQINEKFIVGSVIVREDDHNLIWSAGSSKDLKSPRLMRLNFADENVKILNSFANPMSVEFMPGNGVLYPISVFNSVGYFDEILMPQYHADSELVLRAKKFGNYQPVIALNVHIINNILNSPLVNNLKDLISSKKSDLYWPAVSTLLVRYYPDIDLEWAFQHIYGHFFIGQGKSLDFNL